MISFELFKAEDGIPIYTQIIRYMKRGIVAGIINDGDELPSRRVLSATLGVNPNTVQKAYKMLEDEGLIESKTGAKSCMNLDRDKVEKIRDEWIRNDLKSVISAMKKSGVTKENMLEMMGKLWEEE
ncbi:MAG: GntR family transcriptional regulator [Eubacterium sp.]|nr:GntR family transcriptional regulator [Eubacterium sp.]